MKDLPSLLRALDPVADLADRHVWLIKLFEWIRGDKTSTQAAVARVQAFIEAVQKQPDVQARLQVWWETLLQTVDITPLLADFGFAPRTAFMSELAERLRRKLLPGTPETTDASELFPLVAPTRFDAQWMSALEDSHIKQLTELLSANPAQDTRRWHYSLMDALTYCTAQIRATGFAPELRLRMNRDSPHARAFHALPADVQELHTVFSSRSMMKPRCRAPSGSIESTWMPAGRPSTAFMRTWKKTEFPWAWCFACASCVPACCDSASCLKRCYRPNPPWRRSSC